MLALVACAYTAAGHEEAIAVAEWAAGCSQETLAALGGRRDPWARTIRPPSTRTFARIFEKIDAEAFNAALYGYLASLTASPDVTRHEREQRRAAGTAKEPAVPGLLPQAAADGKTVRGAIRPDGSQVHLLSVFDTGTGRVRRPARDRRQDQRDPRARPRHRAPEPDRRRRHPRCRQHPG